MRRGFPVFVVLVPLLIGGAAAVNAQELVPAAYTPAPYGVNFVTLTSAYNTGDLTFDPSGPISDADGRISLSSLAYGRTFNLAGRAANIGIGLPYIKGHLEGLYIGEPAFADRSGLGDLGIRCAVNLYGAAAMSPLEFRDYRPRTLIGATVSVWAPTGQYDPEKLINIGTNRWALKAEFGFVRVIGRWAVDAYVGGSFFTDNTDFFGGLTREQDPIVSTQAHLRYAFSPKVWAAVDGNFWGGGQTTVEGILNDDRQRNSRVGATVAIRLGSHHSLRFAASTGAITRIGGDFDSIGMSYSYSWMKRPRP
jgi:hypothetical protein